MTGWYSIDTVPQDRTVDLWVVEKTVNSDGTIEITPGLRWPDCEWNVQEQHWVSRNLSGAGYILEDKVKCGRRIATHWMFPPDVPT